MMRDAAITAGLVRSVGARDRDWRDRLHIITYALLPPHPRSLSIENRVDVLKFSEPEAAAVHCAHLTDLHKLKPSQIFMICDAGGGTVVRRALLFWATLGAPDMFWPLSLRISPSIRFLVSWQTLR
jgi:hypothetical protein